MADRGLHYLVSRYSKLSVDVLHSQLTSFTGDTKAGTLIAMDRYGNKYFENLEEELPCEHQ